MATQENIKYLFLDIVGFSNSRTVEAQTKIIENLNTIVLDSIKELTINKKRVLFLPTGDGICICLVAIQKPFDLSLCLGLRILEKIGTWNKTITDDMLKTEVRIGINENIDNVIIDINKRKNASGSGINMAQRIMNCADGNQILLGYSSFEKICDREKYTGKFREYNTKVKHGKILKVFQYYDEDKDYLNSFPPDLFAQPSEIRLRPTNVVNIYSYLIDKFKTEISEMLKEDTSKRINLHIALFYATFRLIEKGEATNFDSGVLYNEYDKYFINGTIDFLKWVDDLKFFNIMYAIDFQDLLIDKYLGNYEYYFQSNSRYYLLSKEGADYQAKNFDSKKYDRLISETSG